MGKENISIGRLVYPIMINPEFYLEILVWGKSVYIAHFSCNIPLKKFARDNLIKKF